MRVMVTGGAGYIGSILVEELVRQGNEVVVYDNLSKGHAEAVDEQALLIVGDLHDGATLRQVLRARRIEAVIHMAAASLVGESVTDPGKYYRENLVAGLSLLDGMRDCEVRQLVFSSTAAVYGEPDRDLIMESDALVPTNPYGQTKLAFENALGCYAQAYGLQYASLRYFNAAGATRRCGERHDPETHLIPLVLQTALGLRGPVQIFGNDYPTRDGTCIRDYIHVADLARAHVLALSILPERSAVFNLGCGGDGYSVREVIETASQVTGRSIPFEVAARRPGDPARLVASAEKIRSELGWNPAFQDLRKIVDSAWSWMRDNSAVAAGDLATPGARALGR